MSMFKKRARPAGVRNKDVTPVVPGDQPESSASASRRNSSPPRVPDDGASLPAEVDEDLTASIDELIVLRRLRRAKQGIDVEKLNRGDARRIKDELGASEKYGLQSRRRKDEDGETDEFADEAERMMRLVRTNNFTQQTNALDTDKHMLAFIEKEMAKKRGAEAGDAKEKGPLDPQAELYRMAQKYEWDKTVAAEEGNVTNSMGMLTSIPEMDLGMENRLRNIEATERAKREMEERRKADAQLSRRPEDEDFAAARYHRPTLRIASDIYAVNDEQREAAGLPLPRYNSQNKHETATDAEVYERFKKR